MLPTWRLEINSPELEFDACLLHFVSVKAQGSTYYRNKRLINYAKHFFCIFACFCLRQEAVCKEKKKEKPFLLVAKRQEGKNR